jgi:glutathione S-transferase
MPETKFYYAPGSCSLCPHILLREAGLEFQGIPMRVTEKRAVFPDSFRLINPKMRVPVLSLDSQIITEVPAICTAISSLVPSMHLMGSTALETARVYEWMSWLSGTLHGIGFGRLFRPGRWTLDVDEGVLEGIKGSGREVVGECFDQIEGKLKGGEWAVGGEFTAVDAYLLVFFRWGNQAGFEMRRRYPKYTKLVEKLVERDAVKKTLEFEKIEATL